MKDNYSMLKTMKFKLDSSLKDAFHSKDKDNNTENKWRNSIKSVKLFIMKIKC